MGDIAVRDIDKGQKKALDLLVEADGFEIRAGILSGVPKYPKDRGGAQVAKVAAVLGLVKGIQNEFDVLEEEIGDRLSRAVEQINAGAQPVDVLLPIAGFLRDKYRMLAMEFHDTGRLRETIRGAVYDEGKWVAGDDPKRPGAKDAIGAPQ
jgi:hypothetical protein